MRLRPPKRKLLRKRRVEPDRTDEKQQRRNFSLNFLLKPIRNDGWIMKVLFVMAGGSIGALSRYGVSLFAAQFLGTRFPFGTLIATASIMEKD